MSISSRWPWPMIVCCSRPIPPSDSTSRMSSSRQGKPLRRYSASPERNRVRVIVTSVNSRGRSPAVLSMVRLTSAMASAGRRCVPAKMTSSIRPPRSDRGPCSPRTQEMASTTLDLPEPLGPTMTLIPGSRASVVLSAKDLNPRSVSDLRNISSDGSRRGVKLHECDFFPLSATRGASGPRYVRAVRQKGRRQLHSATMTELLPRLVTEEATKIVLILIDGLGGVRTDERGSELHAARTPNMDRLAREGSSGLHTVIAPGVTSGSGAGHLAVFGYDPLVYELGRG